MTITFVQFGMGAAGREIVRQAHDKGLQLVGAIDVDHDLLGKDAGLLAGTGKPIGIPVEANADRCLAQAQPEIVLHATAFDPASMVEQLGLVARAGIDVVSLAGISFPWRRHRVMANQLDEEARRAGVTLVGTGHVPGFLTDILPIVLTGGSHKVERIRIIRTSDFSLWGPSVLRRYGFGSSPEAFGERLATGSLTLFANLWQSFDMICAALDWEPSEIGEERQPFVSDRQRAGEHLMVQSGEIGGFRHRIFGRCDQLELDIEVRGFIEPQGDDERSALSVRIHGEPKSEFILSGELTQARGSLLSSAARVVNAIPHALDAPAGLVSLADLPHMAAFLAGGRKPAAHLAQLRDQTRAGKGALDA